MTGRAEMSWWEARHASKPSEGTDQPRGASEIAGRDAVLGPRAESEVRRDFISIAARLRPEWRMPDLGPIAR